MVNQELLDYIKHRLGAGVDREEIKKALIDQGWAERDLEEAFAQVGAAGNSSPVQPPPVQQQAVSEQGAALAGIGALFASAFATFRNRFWRVLLLWLLAAAYSLAAVVPAGIFYVVYTKISGIFVAVFGIVIAVAGLFWVIYVILRASLSCYLLIASPDGSLTARQSWKASSGKVQSFLWVSILSSLVAAGGFVLLIVPGIIVLVAVTFALWVMAVEGLRGREALLRSRSYVKGRWWKVFWRLLVIGIVNFAIVLIFLGVARVIGTAHQVVSLALPAAQFLVNILWGLFTFCYAYELYASAKASAQVDPAAEVMAKRKYTILAVLGLVLPILAVLGLLASIMLVSLNSARAKSRDARRIADVTMIRTALEFYYNDTNQYPQSLNSLSPGYVGELPKPPQPSDGSCVPKQNQYAYKLLGTGDYELRFCLGGAVGGYGGGEHTVSKKGIDQPADQAENLQMNHSSEADADGDNLTDAEEAVVRTDPNNPDTDGDGFNDGKEYKDGYDPLVPGR